jgi:hypothetical protein
MAASKGSRVQAGQLHDVVADEAKVRPGRLRDPLGGVGELTAGEVHAHDLTRRPVGHPRRQRAAAAGQVQHARGCAPTDRREIPFVGPLVGAANVGRVVALLEDGEVKELAPVGVVQVGERVEPGPQVLGGLLRLPSGRCHAPLLTIGLPCAC